MCHTVSCFYDAWRAHRVGGGGGLAKHRKTEGWSHPRIFQLSVLQMVKIGGVPEHIL